MSKQIRTVVWGHWGLSFWNGDARGDLDNARAVARLDFGVGPQGPVDGFIGSPERAAYQSAGRAWVDRGELPEGAMVPIEQAWLFDNDNRCPRSLWVDGRWVSAVRVGRNWEFPKGL